MTDRNGWRHGELDLEQISKPSASVQGGNENIVMVQGEDGTHSDNAEQTHSLRKLGNQFSRCTNLERSQPGSRADTFLQPVSVLSTRAPW